MLFVDQGRVLFAVGLLAARHYATSSTLCRQLIHMLHATRCVCTIGHHQCEHTYDCHKHMCNSCLSPLVDFDGLQLHRSSTGKGSSRTPLSHVTASSRTEKPGTASNHTTKYHKENVTPPRSRQSFVKPKRQVFADFGVQVFAPLPRAISPEREVPKQVAPDEASSVKSQPMSGQRTTHWAQLSQLLLSFWHQRLEES